MYFTVAADGTVLSVTIFDDEDQCLRSNDLAAEFVRTHMAQLLRQKPEVIEGSIKAHS